MSRLWSHKDVCGTDAVGFCEGLSGESDVVSPYSDFVTGVFALCGRLYQKWAVGDESVSEWVAVSVYCTADRFWHFKKYLGMTHIRKKR